MRIRFSMALLASVLFLSWVSATSVLAGPTPAEKCLAKKIKEAAKYDGCRLKAAAKAVIKGETADLEGCNEKLTDKWDKLDASGGCVLTGDQLSFQSIADVHTNAVVELLTNGPGANCGNGIIEGLEDCDSADLGGGTCTTQGFGGGTLACSGSCSYDTAACVVASCGNGTIELGEQCDGADLANRTCSSLGFSNGVGSLTCDVSCKYDTSSCTELCGNGTIDAVAFESCDGANLDGKDCTDFGANGGTLACSAGCFFDLSGCSFTCGNNNREAGEECDGTDLAGRDCTDQGFVGGTLGCDGSCTFDTGSCISSCGDGIVSTGAGEECDGMVAGPASTCGQLGYTGGTLGCTGGCLNDVSGCTLDCDVLTQDCAVSEGCYLDFMGPGGCLPESAGGEYDFCQAQSDCQSRYFCSSSDGVTGSCLAWCDTTLGNADCSAGQTCFSETVLLPAQPDAGVCIPTF